jgi:hypothetical protein
MVMKLGFEIDITKSLEEINAFVLEKLNEVKRQNNIKGYSVDFKNGLLIDCVDNEKPIKNYYKITLQKLKEGIDENKEPLTAKDWTKEESWFVDLNAEKEYEELINVVKTLLKRY